MNQSCQKRVLVIEDDPNTANLVALYLDKDGFETAKAHNGETGLALARRLSPHLVVLDLIVLGCGGLELAVVRFVAGFHAAPH